VSVPDVMADIIAAQRDGSKDNHRTISASRRAGRVS